MLQTAALFLCLAVVSFASCGDDEGGNGPEPVVPELSAAPADLSFVAAGETKTIEVKARNVAWKATTTAEWLTLTDASGSADGTVRVEADPNTGDKALKATILISGEGVETVTVNVSQAAADAPLPEVSASVKNLTFTCGDYYSKEFTVEADGEWTAVADAAWIELDQKTQEGSYNGTVTVSVAKNGGAARDTEIVLCAKTDETPLVRIPVTQKEAFASDLAGLYKPFVADPSNPVGEFFITPTYPAGTEEPTVDLSFILGAPLPISFVTELANQIVGMLYSGGLDHFEFRDDGTIAAGYRTLLGFDLNNGASYSEEVFTYPNEETLKLVPSDAITYYTENGKVYFCIGKAYLTAIGQSELQTDLTAMIEGLIQQYPEIGQSIVSNEEFFGLPLNYRTEGGKVRLWLDRETLMPFIPLLSELSETMLPEEITVQLDPNDPQTAMTVPVKNLVKELLEGLFVKTETLEIGISLAKQ